MRFRLLAASLAILAGGIMTANEAEIETRQSFAASPAFLSLKAKSPYMAGAYIRIAAPVYGERCVTRIGTCQILPQPVGSPCRCGDVTGTTLQ